ncbi:MAG: HhH-GPD family protein, partial [Microthrixaceae bacterium]
DLPWRRTRDPWKILVAEVMLQQTQVDRVVPRWHSFLERWPDPASGASADLADVLAEWSGLGYPRRARNLWLTAAVVVVEHGGRLPDELDVLLGLPGIGPYTARAVLAFAHERDAAVVDTNVGRILARRAGRPLTPKQAQQQADEWVPAGRGWAWNQGLLDLGALRCRPTSPDCDGCPVAPGCRWWLAGASTPDPARRSAAVSRPQARFEGSARQARGRLLRAVEQGAVSGDDLVDVIGWADREDAEADAIAVADSLLADGLIARDAHGRWVTVEAVSPPGSPAPRG